MGIDTGNTAPFRFYTRFNLTELTGLRASNLKQLVQHLKDVPGSCIYHHTHRFLQQHQFLSPEPPNDFAFWVRNSLGEKELSEKLASIDTMQFGDISGLRNKIILVIEDHIRENPSADIRFSSRDDSFHFMKSISFIMPTEYEARDLSGFADIMKKITVDSIYFHVFEARLRLEKAENDFSNWFRNSLGETGLADAVSRLDPYAHTLEELRNRTIMMVEKKLGK